MSASPSERATAHQARIVQAIFRAIDEVNPARPFEMRVQKSLEAALIGEDAVLDSLGLVNLIVAIEEQIAEGFGVTINIADEKARSQPSSPFRTIQMLAAYISTLLEGQDHG